jgi:DNA-binding response OmpR family regulator
MSRKRVLIVEDDPSMRQFLQLHLESQNYDSLPVGDSITALSEARKQRPDLIILDLGLPGGGGMVFLQRLQALPLLSTIPVIVLSARQRSVSEQPALDAGATAFFQKPPDPEQLLKKFASCWASPSYTTASARRDPRACAS